MGVLDQMGGGMTIPSEKGFLQASSCLPCTAAEEREVVDALTREAEKNVKHGDLRYLVSQRLKPSIGFQYMLSAEGSSPTDELSDFCPNLLKFLCLHCGTLKSYFETIPESELKKYMADILFSVNFDDVH